MSATLLALATMLLPAGVGDADAGWSEVAKLWPGAKVQVIRRHGERRTVLSPVKRRGEVGFIDLVERHEVKGLGVILTFSIRLAKAPPDLRGWMAGRVKPPEQVRHVVQALFLAKQKKGPPKISKPDGFPLERVVNTTCMGDVCGHGPLYLRLIEVKNDSGIVVLLVSPNGYGDQVGHVLKVDHEGLSKLFEVDGPRRLASETGCDATSEWVGLRWDKKNARLMATVKERCGCVPDCREHGFAPGTVTEERALAPRKR